MLIKSALRDLLFCVIGHENSSADWLATLATPYPGCAGLLHGKACHTILRSLRFLTNRVPLPPLFRGQNKTPRNTLFINGSTISAGYSAPVEVLHRTSKWGEVRRLACPLRRFPFAAPPNCGGKVVAPATKGGIAFPRPSGRLYGFRRQRRHFKLPSEPARSVGRTHRSVRNTNDGTRAPKGT